jgi:imidazolonepropionase-like amidohydrolase
MHGGLYYEMRALVELGCAPLRVLRLATSEGAAALGIGDGVGWLRTGSLADVIAVDGNPLDDMRVMANPRFVMSHGRIVRRPVDSGERGAGSWEAPLEESLP